MADLKLEPYAVVLNFVFPEIQDRWEELISQLLLRIAKESKKSERAIVGHIKALTVFQDNQFIRMSVIAPEIPLTTEGQIPSGSTELEMTLNVLVYGVSGITIEEITRSIANEIAREWNGKIVLQ